MIVKELYKTRADGVNLYKTYSDQTLKIRKIGTNEIYNHAIDVEGAPFEYEETNINILTYEELQFQRLVKDVELKAKIEAIKKG